MTNWVTRFVNLRFAFLFFFCNVFVVCFYKMVLCLCMMLVLSWSIGGTN